MPASEEGIQAPYYDDVLEVLALFESQNVGKDSQLLTAFRAIHGKILAHTPPMRNATAGYISGIPACCKARRGKARHGRVYPAAERNSDTPIADGPV